MPQFRPRFQSPLRRKNPSPSRRVLRAIAWFCAVIAIWWFVIRPFSVPSESFENWVVVEEQFSLCGSKTSSNAPAKGCVVDGDTAIIGFGPNRRRIRFTSYDAPELDGECKAERELALKAREQLHQWLTQGPFEWSGGAEPPYDQFGRELREARRLKSNGSYQLLAEVMIEGKMGSANGWGKIASNWCDRP